MLADTRAFHYCIDKVLVRKHGIVTEAADVTLRLGNGSKAVSGGTCQVSVDIQQYSATVEGFCSEVEHMFLLESWLRIGQRKMWLIHFMCRTV